MNERKSKQNRKINLEKPLVDRSNVEEKSKIENRNWIENEEDCKQEPATLLIPQDLIDEEYSAFVRELLTFWCNGVRMCTLVLGNDQKNDVQ